MKLRSEARILQRKAISSLRRAMTAFNSPDDDGRVTNTLMSLQHSFEMLLKAALVQARVAVFDRRTQRSISFEACVNATGDYSLERLWETMADLGLTTRPTRRWPSQPVSVSKLHRMLRDPYYTGLLVYKGATHPGRHEAIISQELFDRVQEVMDARSQRGQRDRLLFHYLKGLLYCDRCRQNGRTSRMIYTEAQGRGGIRYEYFVCRGRQDGLCDLPHLPAAQVEDAITRHYATLGLPADFVAVVRGELEATMADQQSTVKELHSQLKTQLARLEVQEERLLDLAAEGDPLRARLS